MGYELTFSMIKPDAARFMREIQKMILDEGLEIVKFKPLILTIKQAKGFYAERSEKVFYEGLVDFMTSGPVIAQIIAGDFAVARNRKLMGHTNPQLASAGTIREKFGSGMPDNAVHGSDSAESVIREIAFFFSSAELIG